MERDERFINYALFIAKLSKHRRHKVGAIITKGSRILSVGINKVKTHPLQHNTHTKKHGKSIHAELSAILGLSTNQRRGSTIYVARLLADESYGLAKPCSYCMALIEEVEIKKVVWTISKRRDGRYVEAIRL